MKKINSPPHGGWGHYDSPHVVHCQSKKRGSNMHEINEN